MLIDIQMHKYIIGLETTTILKEGAKMSTVGHLHYSYQSIH